MPKKSCRRKKLSCKPPKWVVRRTLQSRSGNTEEALATLEASLNAQHEKEMKTVNENLDQLNSTVQKKDDLLNQMSKEIGN